MRYFGGGMRTTAQLVVVLGLIATQLSIAQVSGGYIGPSSRADTWISGKGAVPEAGKLLVVAFPKAVQGNRDGAVFVATSDENLDADQSGDDASEMQMITPIALIKADETNVALIVERVAADATGVVRAAHPSQAIIDAYFFTKRYGAITLDHRKVGILNAGFFGSIDRSDVFALTPTSRAVTLTYGTCFQGECGTWVSVFVVSQGKVVVWADALPLSADNLSAEEVCSRYRLRGVPLERGCYSAVGTFDFGRGSFRTKPSDLVIRFKSALTGDQSRDGKMQESKAGGYVNTVAVYRVINGKYVLLRGSNPVPRF